MMKLIVSFLLGSMVLLQWGVWFGDGSIPNAWALETSIKYQLRENRELADRNAALAAEVRDFKQGLEAFEERARFELGMIKKGETYYQLVE